ncbi:MAG: hypothetical protein M1825_002650 [Sarcosagium campestre]|nr:MAG: hypothetical protein M1825_002650 [Sarcosagium campestre]
MATRQNQYFLPGDGIRREVITADICRYLGNDALVRPGQYEGRDGFWVTAYRALTSDMIADLKADSMRWTAEYTARSHSGPSGRSTREVGVSGKPNKASALTSYEGSTTHYERQVHGPSAEHHQPAPRGGHPSHRTVHPPSGPQGFGGAAGAVPYQGNYAPPPAQIYRGDYQPETQGSSYEYTSGSALRAETAPRTAAGQPYSQVPQGDLHYPQDPSLQYQVRTQQPPGVPRGGQASHHNPGDQFGRGGY